MSIKSERTDTDSEAASRSPRRGKLTAILCPTACALLLVLTFAACFIAAKLAYEQHDALCARRRFDRGKLYVFPNVTLMRISAQSTLRSLLKTNKL